MQKNKIITHFFLFIQLIACPVLKIQASPMPSATEVITKYEKKITLLNDHRIKIWIEKGWLLAERTDAQKQLIWRLPISKADFTEKPTVEYDNEHISIKLSQKNLFLANEMDGIFNHYLRGLIQGPLDAFDVQFDPQQYGLKFKESLGGSRHHSRTLWEKDNWNYLAIGGKLYPYIGAIFRMVHNSLDEGRMENLFSSSEMNFSWDDTEFYFDGQLLFVKQISGINFERKWQRIQQKVTNLIAPDLKVEKWLNCDTEIRLADLRGKVILLNFENTWNAPCRQRLKNINSLFEQFRPKGLEAVVLYSGEEREKFTQFSRKNLFILPIGFDQKKLAEKYQIANWPAYFLIDKKGVIRRANLRNLPDQKLIELLLAE